MALRGGEALVLDEAAATVLRVRVDREAVRTVELSADGRRLLTLDQAQELELWEVATGERLYRWRPARGAKSVGAALAKDGGAVLHALDDGLWLRTPDDTPARRVPEADPGLSCGFFSAWIWGGDTQGRLRLWSAADLSPGPALALPEGPWVAVVAGEQLMVSDQRGTVWVVQEDGTLGPAQRAPGFHDQRFAAAPDGRRFTYVADGPAASDALVTVDLRHAVPLSAVAEPGDRVESLVWSPQGRTLAIASADTLRLVPATRLNAPPEPPFGVLPALMVGFDAEARHALAVFGDGEVWLWNPDTGQDEARFTLPLARDRGDRAVVDLHPDGSRLAWADAQGRVHVRTLAEGTDTEQAQTAGDPLVRWGPEGALGVAEPGRLRTWDHQGAAVLDLSLPRPDRLAVGQDGIRVAVSDTDGRVLVLEGPRGERVAELPPGPCAVETLRFRRDGDLVVLDRCGAVRWVGPGGEVRTLGQLGPLNRAALDPAGELLLVLHGAERMSRYDLSTWQDLGPVGERWPEPLGLHLERAAVHPDGRRALTAGDLGQVQLWDLDSGVLLRTFTGHRPGGFALAVDPRGQVVSSTHAGRLLLRQGLGDGATREQRPLEAEVFALASSPDGALLALGDGAGRVRLVRAADGAVLAEAQPLSGAVVSLGFSADGWRLVARDESGALVVLGREGRVLREISRAPVTVRGEAWSPGGASLLVVSDEGVLWTWDGAAWWPRRAPRGAVYTGPIAWCPEGLVLAVRDTRHPETRAWWMRQPEGRARALPGGEPATAVACGGGLYALADGRGRVRVLTREGELRLLTRTDSTQVAALGMLPDGRVLALNQSGAVRAWDPQRSAILWRGGPQDTEGEPLPVQVIPRVGVEEEELGLEIEALEVEELGVEELGVEELEGQELEGQELGRQEPEGQEEP